MSVFPSEFDLVEIHERACKAIAALGRTQREIAILMGIDVSIPRHERTPPEPSLQNIQRVSQILGVSFKWLTTGIPETHMDFVVSRPFVALYGHNIVTGNSNAEIEINSNTCAQHALKQKNPCPTCINRHNRDKN